MEKMHLKITDLSVRESGSRMLSRLKNGTIRKQNITNKSVPFEDEELYYQAGFTRFLKTKNCAYLLECTGRESERRPDRDADRPSLYGVRVIDDGSKESASKSYWANRHVFHCFKY